MWHRLQHMWLFTFRNRIKIWIVFYLFVIRHLFRFCFSSPDMCWDSTYMSFLCVLLSKSPVVYIYLYTANKENMWVLYFHPKKKTVLLVVIGLFFPPLAAILMNNSPPPAQKRPIRGVFLERWHVAAFVARLAWTSVSMSEERRDAFLL